MSFAIVMCIYVDGSISPKYSQSVIFLLWLCLHLGLRFVRGAECQ